MFTAVYRWFHRQVSDKGQRGEYSAGRWQEAVRRSAAAVCLAQPGCLLEVGCGEGLFLKSIVDSDAQRRCWGVDTDEVRVQRAVARLSNSQARVSVGDATRLAFADNSFDQVVCINVLFNLPSTQAVAASLAQISRVCRPQGTVLFDFRNAANQLLRWKYRLAPWYDPTVRNLPLRTYRLEEIRALAEGAGLQVVRLHYPAGGNNRTAALILVEARKS